jgi:signal transduction histidine kinase
MISALLTLSATREHDIVLARQQARQIASLLGIDAGNQTRFATAVSEIVRNALNYGGGGQVEFALEGAAAPQTLLARVTDEGEGITNLTDLLNGQGQPDKGTGLINARRLVDQFKIESQPGKGTVVEMRQFLPKAAPPITANRLAQITKQLGSPRSQDPFDEVRRQNKELMRTLDELRLRQEDLARLNQELEDTNRGVVALYSELDEKADRLRQADEMKSRFLSYMSHEFRTPLNSILALARLLLDRSDGELTEEQEKQVSFISRSAEELTELVDDLLDLAKIEAGKVEAHPAKFEVANLFGALRGMLRPMLASEQVSLIFEAPEDMPTLHTDEGKVAQILRNFLSNALKFTERGEVRVCAELTSNGRAVTFSVADTGIGIAPEDQERIFQEFAQVQSSLQKKVKGTGLGLPLCRKLAEFLGGGVAVTSAPGAGSTFYATIPITYPLLNAPQVTKKALVIDDEEASRYLLCKLLAAAYPSVVEAADGASGLRLALEEQPQLICLDLMMPDMSGTEVLARLKADERTAHIPILIVTSKALDRKEYKHLTTHAAALLPKAELSQKTVHAVLEKVSGFLKSDHTGA